MFRPSNSTFNLDEVQIEVEYRDPSGQFIRLSGILPGDISRREFFQKFYAQMPEKGGAPVRFRATIVDVNDDANGDLKNERLPVETVDANDPELVAMRQSRQSDSTPASAPASSGTDPGIILALKLVQEQLAAERAAREAAENRSLSLQEKLMDVQSNRDASASAVYDGMLQKSTNLQGDVLRLHMETDKARREAEEALRREREADRRRDEEDARQRRIQEREDRDAEARREREDRAAEAKLERERLRAEAETRIAEAKAAADARIAEIQAKAEAEAARQDRILQSERDRQDNNYKLEMARIDQRQKDEDARIEQRRQDEAALAAKREDMNEKYLQMQLEVIRSLGSGGKTDTEQLLDVITVKGPEILGKLGIGTDAIKGAVVGIINRLTGNEDADGAEQSGTGDALLRIVEAVLPGAMGLAQEYIKNRPAPSPTILPAPAQMPVPAPPPAPGFPPPAPPQYPALPAPNPIQNQERPPEPQTVPVVAGMDPAAVQAAHAGIQAMIAAIHRSSGGEWPAVVAGSMTAEVAAYLQTVGAHVALVDEGDLQSSYYPAIKAACQSVIGVEIKD
jgi:hypothetical protein